MKRIFKYRLLPGAEQTIEMPEGAEVLSVQAQRNVANLWALADEEAPLRGYAFFVCPTGEPVPEGLVYVGTFQLADGRYVYHLFQRPAAEGHAAC